MVIWRSVLIKNAIIKCNRWRPNLTIGSLSQFKSLCCWQDNQHLITSSCVVVFRTHQSSRFSDRNDLRRLSLFDIFIIFHSLMRCVVLSLSSIIFAFINPTFSYRRCASLWRVHHAISSAASTNHSCFQVNSVSLVQCVFIYTLPSHNLSYFVRWTIEFCIFIYLYYCLNFAERSVFLAFIMFVSENIFKSSSKEASLPCDLIIIYYYNFFGADRCACCCSAWCFFICLYIYLMFYSFCSFLRDFWTCIFLFLNKWILIWYGASFRYHYYSSKVATSRLSCTIALVKYAVSGYFKL